MKLVVVHKMTKCVGKLNSYYVVVRSRDGLYKVQISSSRYFRAKIGERVTITRSELAAGTEY